MQLFPVADMHASDDDLSTRRASLKVKPHLTRMASGNLGDL